MLNVDSFFIPIPETEKMMYKTFSVTNGHGQIFYYAAYSQHDAERQAHLDIGVVRR